MQVRRDGVFKEGGDRRGEEKWSDSGLTLMGFYSEELEGEGYRLLRWRRLGGEIRNSVWDV